MKILLINNEFPPIGGGGSTVTTYAMKYLVEWGHEVTLITSSFRHLPRRETVHGATVIRVPAIRRFSDFCSVWELALFGISALFFALWYVPRFRPDAVVAYFALPAGGVARVLKAVYGTPYLVYFGGSDMPGANPSRYRKIYPFLRVFTRWIWRGATLSTVCSHGLLALGRTLDPEYDFRLVPNGVELSRFVPIERGPNPKVTILFIGRLIARKGFQYVVRALPRIRELTHTPFEIEVVGTGTMRKVLDELATELGVSQFVKYVGTMPYTSLHERYQHADIFVLTSESEGMPAATLEAMGCGLPIVTTNVPGNQEIVQHGDNGFLIDVGDTEALAQSLARLIADEQLRKRMGARSRQRAQPYEWQQIVRQYEHMIIEVVATERSLSRG